MRFLSIIFIAIFLFASCKTAPTADNTGFGTKRYQLKGKVIAVDKAAKKANINHEEVPGYMPAMTMDFPIREDWVWEDLVAGAEIRAELVVDNEKGEYWLEKIGIVEIGRAHV